MTAPLTPDRLRALGDVAIPLGDVAATVGLHRYSVTRLEQAGKFPARIEGRGRPHYRASDVLRWLTGSWQAAGVRTFLRSHRRAG